MNTIFNNLIKLTDRGMEVSVSVNHQGLDEAGFKRLSGLNKIAIKAYIRKAVRVQSIPKEFSLCCEFDKHDAIVSIKGGVDGVYEQSVLDSVRKSIDDPEYCDCPECAPPLSMLSVVSSLKKAAVDALLQLNASKIVEGIDQSVLAIIQNAKGLEQSTRLFSEDEELIASLKSEYLPGAGASFDMERDFILSLASLRRDRHEGVKEYAGSEKDLIQMYLYLYYLSYENSEKFWSVFQNTDTSFAKRQSTDRDVVTNCISIVLQCLCRYNSGLKNPLTCDISALIDQSFLGERFDNLLVSVN